MGGGIPLYYTCTCVHEYTLTDVGGRALSRMNSGRDEYHSLSGVRLKVVRGTDGHHVQSSLLLQTIY